MDRRKAMTVTQLDNLDLHQAEQAEPKYKRLKDYLVAELTAGRLKPGEALPPELRLAGTLRVARQTVRKALAGLEREGLIRRVRGKGTFVHQDVRHRLRQGLDVFALVIPETQGHYYPSLLHGFETACSQVRTQAIVCSTECRVEKQSDVILQLLDTRLRGGDRALHDPAHPALPDPPASLPERSRGFLPSRRQRGPAPVLAVEFHRVGRMVGEAFLQRAHRRAALFAIGPDEVAQTTRPDCARRCAPAAATCPTSRLLRHDVLPDVSLQEEAVLNALEQMCRGADRPTAIMASFDSMGELIYLLLGRLGMRVPEDISLVTLAACTVGRPSSGA